MRTLPRLIGSTATLLVPFAFACVGELASDPTKVAPDGGADALPNGSDGATSAFDAKTVTPDADAPDVAPDAPVVVPDPAAIFGTNLVLWLDASEPSTIVLDPDARIGEWKDRSTFANHAKMLYSGTGSVNVVSNAVNQHPALKFSGDPANTGMFEVEDVTSLQLGTNDFMIVAVAAYSNTPGYDEFGGRATLISKAADSYPYYGFALAGNAYNAPLADGGLGGPDSILFGGIKSFVDGKNAGAWSSNRGLNDSRFRAFAVRKDSANQAVYVHANGVATSSVADIDTAQSLSAFGGKVMIAGQKLAGQSSIGSPIKGYLAEIFLVRGTSGTTLERQQLAAYLQAKYALPF